MLLVTVDGSEFELTVVGYQFPQAMNAGDDWLVLHIRMKTGVGLWEGKDPVLVWEEARDLRELAGWDCERPSFRGLVIGLHRACASFRSLP